MDEIVKIGAELHAESHYAHLGFAPEKVRQLAIGMIDHGFVCIDVASDGAIRGMLAGLCQPHWFSHDKTAMELSFYVRPAFRGNGTAARLIHAFHDWARLEGARHVEMSANSGIDRTIVEKLYERMGATNIGTQFKWRID